MAIARWISQDGNFGAGGSWSTGSVPGSSDVAQFDGGSQKDVLSGLTIANVLNLITTPAYRGSIGQSGNPLIGAITNKLLHRGSGSIHYTGSAATKHLVIDSANQTQAANVNLSSSSSSTLTVKAGRCLISAASSGQFTISRRTSAPAILESISPTGVSVLTMVNRGGQVLGGWADVAGVSVLSISGGGTMTATDFEWNASRVFIFDGNFAVANNPTGSRVIDQLNIYTGIADFSALTETLTISTLNIYGGEVERSDFLTVTTERDFRLEHPNF